MYHRMEFGRYGRYSRLLKSSARHDKMSLCPTIAIAHASSERQLLTLPSFPTFASVISGTLSTMLFVSLFHSIALGRSPNPRVLLAHGIGPHENFTYI